MSGGEVQRQGVGYPQDGDVVQHPSASPAGGGTEPEAVFSALDVAIAEVVQERRYQDEKWGADRNLANGQWFLILGEEIGESAEASLEAATASDERGRAYWLAELRRELVQVAAVAVAWIENLERSGIR